MAADTRITWGKPTIYIEDGEQKLIKTSLGLLTGSGFSELLNSVSDRIAEETITSTNQIEEIVQSEIDCIYCKYEDYPSPHFSLDDLEHYVRCTNWIYSYQTQNDNGEYLLRMSLIVGPKSSNDSCVSYLSNDGSVGILLPEEFDNSQREFYRQRLNDELLSNISTDFKANIITINSVFHDLIEEIANISECVSSEYHLGIHTFGDVEIFSPEDTKLLRLQAIK